MEKQVTIDSDGLQLYGLLHRGTTDCGVLITHPHPLYGGDMFNPVVETVADAYRKCGHTTLRFNFRGVGKSQGSFDDGNGERRDVSASLARLKEIGVTHIDLAGYSFGAWVNALPGDGAGLIRHIIMISPPVAFIEFSPEIVLPALKLVVTGSRDEIAPEPLVRKNLLTWNSAARFELIEGADHFYFGYLEALESILVDHLNCI